MTASMPTSSTASLSAHPDRSVDAITEADAATLDPDVAALLPRLASDDAATRRVALLDIADLEAPSAIGVICAVLRDDPDPVVRAEAAQILASWESEAVVHALAHALSDVEESVRHAAADALAQSKDEQIAPALATWLDRPESFIRAAIFRALRELRYPGAFNAALDALRDADARVRVEAVALLGWLRDARATGALAQALATDGYAEVRRAASAALGMASIFDSLAIRALLAALNDDEWLVRESAAATLGRIAARDATHASNNHADRKGSSATNDEVGAARPETPRSDEAGLSLSTAPSSDDVATALPRTLLDALIDALDDTYWQVRIQAARALGRLGDPLATGPLTRTLTHSISNLRKEAALALGEIGDRAALPALEHALADADPEVRKAVRIALAQIGS